MIQWDDDTIAISQEKLIGEALARFGMLSCAPCTTPLPGGVTLTSVTAHPPFNPDEESRYRSMVGTLQYIATMTRPDLCYAASTLAKFMASPNREHYLCAEHAFWYVSTTATHRLVFGGTSGPMPTGVSSPWHGGVSCLIYADSD
jgi:hypothetical protein